VTNALSVSPLSKISVRLVILQLWVAPATEGGAWQRQRLAWRNPSRRNLQARKRDGQEPGLPANPSRGWHQTPAYRVSGSPRRWDIKV